MAIDESGKWWKGTELGDIAAYLSALEPGGYPVDRVVDGRCGCGSTLLSSPSVYQLMMIPGLGVLFTTSGVTKQTVN